MALSDDLRKRVIEVVARDCMSRNALEAFLVVPTPGAMPATAPRPSVPTPAASPPEAGAPDPSAPVPTGAMPARRIPTVVEATVYELCLFDIGRLRNQRRRAQRGSGPNPRIGRTREWY